jgi:transglutaminase-like putative cysteine protease
MSSVERYRRPSLFVQSDDARIIAKAAEIVGPRTDPWEQTVALNQWVFSTLAKRLTVGLPSAVDVLLAPAGDCHEHTVLFTALARSLALPTRMVAGLVSWQGRLFYHAWPEVWIGQWIPTDPTLGQLIADATHLGLTEAENEQLIALGQFIGKLRVQVVAVVREAPHTAQTAP